MSDLPGILFWLGACLSGCGVLSYIVTARRIMGMHELNTELGKRPNTGCGDLWISLLGATAVVLIGGVIAGASGSGT